MKYYAIDGVNYAFPTLREAKWHCEIAYTPNERKKFLHDTCITKVVNDEVKTYTRIYVSDSGKLSFGRSLSA